MKVTEAYYGVDRVTSSFVVIITDLFTLNINNMGVSLSSEDDECEPELLLTDSQRRFVIRTRERFLYARQTGNKFPNIDYDTIFDALRCFGLNEPKTAIIKNLDSICRIDVGGVKSTTPP